VFSHSGKRYGAKYDVGPHQVELGTDCCIEAESYCDADDRQQAAPYVTSAKKKKAAAYRGLFICSGRVYMRFAAVGGKVNRILCFFASEDFPVASSLPLAAPGMAGAVIRCAPEPGSAADLPTGDFLSCANPDAATMAMAVSNSNARVRMGASLEKLDYRDRGAA
jgi:hypothetical protein